VGAAFAMIKRYGDDQSEWSRPVRKPVQGSVRVAVDGVETTAFEVDATTGWITFDTAPAGGATVTAGFEFDTPVRFDSDRIEVTLETFEAGRMAALPLIEVRT